MWPRDEDGSAAMTRGGEVQLLQAAPALHKARLFPYGSPPEGARARQGIHGHKQAEASTPNGVSSC